MLRVTIMAAMFISVLAASQAAARTWTSASGAVQIEAELIEKRADGTVVLKKSDGVTIETKPDKFSAADQEFIRSWKPAEAKSSKNEFEDAEEPAPSDAGHAPQVKEALGKLKGAEAAAALKAFEQREKELRDTYTAKQAEYRDKLAALLEDALKEATTAGNLDEAVAIRNAIKALKAGKDPPLPGGGAPAANAEDSSAAVRLSTLPVVGLSDIVHIQVPNQLWTKATLGGEEIEDGINMHPWENKPALVAFRLNGKFESIRGKAGIDNDVPSAAAMPVSFILMGDKKVVWKSKPLQRSGEVEAFDVKIPKVRVLTLMVQTGGANQNAHARWGDVQLTPVAAKGKGP